MQLGVHFAVVARYPPKTQQHSSEAEYAREEKDSHYPLKSRAGLRMFKESGEASESPEQSEAEAGSPHQQRAAVAANVRGRRANGSL